MNLINKITFASIGLMTMATLTACQSTPNLNTKDHPRDMKHHEMKHHHAKYQQDRHQKMHGKHKALYAQMQKACEQKTSGTEVQVQVGDKQIKGSCQVYFKADRNQLKNKRSHQMPQDARPMRGDFSARGEVLTDAKRAELTQQYAQRLADKQAKQQAFVKACQGQTAGKSVQIKVGEQNIQGQCMVRFTPEKPAQA